MVANAYDIVVVGSGPAGQKAAIQGAKAGKRVVLIEQEAQAKKQYTLVGQDEADLKFSRISVQSPVGRALIGKRVGDVVEVTTPAKVVEYEVMEIRFEEL